MPRFACDSVCTDSVNASAPAEPRRPRSLRPEDALLSQESVLLCWLRPTRGRLVAGRPALRGMDSVGLIAPAHRSHRAVQPQFAGSTTG